MAPSSAPDSESDQIQAFVAWIDRAVEEHLPSEKVASVLTEHALPGDRGLVSPFLYGSEGWYWPWNRVGFAYIERGRYRDAAQIFTCAYLASLRVQNDYQERFHKGMSLCNISYSFLRGMQPLAARIPAALGLIEDITTFIDPGTTGNLNNLRASACPEALIQRIVAHATETYRGKGRYPLYPEVVLHSLLSDSRDVSRCIADMREVASQFASEPVGNSFAALMGLWKQYTMRVLTESSRGDLAHGRAEPTVRVGPPLSGAISASGSAPAR
jgi:hypothetical protein